ncbi:hypothetical protein [Alicyclobacillus tolerans]|uniref:Uncharacterized protein n=2 Tax=Alicyclobacillus tolerans TaxID=90970 RepID=A0ABT9LXC0_9BACL|nr:hypothetical protein [Alicyclobacillus tengchongensis]MDP9728909.1 hypothetical protein [Alicyclobacillus tengchongensis]SHK31782.1 hypothetical protein SAMN05443507_11211 [Alicyclobacillus montanus]
MKHLKSIFHSRVRKSLFFTFIAVCSGLAVGCGAPDISHMKPSVSKKAAEIFITSSTQGWTTAQAVYEAEKSNLDVWVQSVKVHQLIGQIQQFHKKAPQGLAVVVGQWGNADVGSSQGPLALVPLSASTGHGKRLTVKESEVDAAYVVGYLAGLNSRFLAMPQIGLLAGISSQPSAAAMAAALAGVYQANPKCSIILQNIPSVQRSTHQSVYFPSQTSLPAPQLVLAAGTLSSAAQSWLLQSHSLVYHLSAAPLSASNDVAAFGFPGPSILPELLQRYEQNDLPTSGVLSVVTPHLVILQDKMLPVSLIQAAHQLIGQIIDGKLNPSVAWSKLPGNLQAAWNPFIQSGS